MPRLYCVRHGQTDWNAEGRYQGRADRTLDIIGRMQAQAIGLRLGRIPVDRIYASDLTRAMTTARAIASIHGLEIIPEPRLREIDFGAWEGLTSVEVRARFPESAERRASDADGSGPEGGESASQVRTRVRAVLDELRLRPARERIVVVAHGGTLRVLFSLLDSDSAGDLARTRLDTALTLGHRCVTGRRTRDRAQ
jgi:broad specificity phosphatase PhoE